MCGRAEERKNVDSKERQADKWKRSPKSRNEGETLPAVGVGMEQETAVLQEAPLAGVQ